MGETADAAAEDFGLTRPTSVSKCTNRRLAPCRSLAVIVSGKALATGKFDF